MKSQVMPLALASMMLSLTGCTLTPEYERPAMPVPEVYPELEVASPSHSAESPAADVGWRNLFADHRLQRLIELALQNNRDLKVAVLRVAQAQSEYRVQRSAQGPSVNASVDMQRTRTPSNLSVSGQTVAHTVSAGVTAAWELDLFGRLQGASAQALAKYFATAEARRASEIALVAQVADQYFVLRSQEERLALTRASLLSSQESEKIARIKYDGGTGTELALRESQGVVEQRQSDLAGQQRASARAENALVLLIGMTLPQNLPAPALFHLPNLVADVAPGVPSELLERRPDVMQAEHELRAANANIGVARAAFFPSISLTGQLGKESLELGGLFAAGQTSWAFVPKLTLPIFNAGRNQANLDSVRVARDIAVANYEKAIQVAFREVADGLAARGTYVDQIDQLNRYVATQERRLDLAEMRYQRGVDTYLNVLSAQEALYAAQQSLITVRLDRLTNLVDLYRALGGGWIDNTGAPARFAMSTPSH